jgi:dipeptidyl aminopeptidase/acylaminoacyl peptidase
MHILRLSLLCGALLVGASIAVCAQTVTEENGNIIFSNADGIRKPLTGSGHDSAPALSPDGKFVVFVRDTPDKIVATGSGDVAATELWIIGSDGSKPSILVRGKESTDPKQVIGGIAGAQFSPDGHRVYFVSAAWATSGAIHVLELASRKEHFFTDGSGLEFVSSGDYKGCLLIQKHKYFIGGGAYDWFWLIKPDGKEVGPVGEDTENFHSSYENTVTPVPGRNPKP